MADPDRRSGGAYCGLNMVGNGLALVQLFVALVFQLRGDELDAGGSFNGFEFNLAGVVIAQLRFGHFDYRKVGMSDQSFTEITIDLPAPLTSNVSATVW